jgi:hypothetical protein
LRLRGAGAVADLEKLERHLSSMELCPMCRGSSPPICHVMGAHALGRWLGEMLGRARL